ncbi:MAG: RIP metalloprotease RseP [Bacteroidota bacterium]
MSSNRNTSFKRLGIIGAIILGVLLMGYLTGNIQLVLDILSAIGLILIAISVLVTVHELGHFLTAKAFGMRVETFSIGFPPKLFSFTKGETEYQIGATPLGGYVKISGIIDESFDTEYLSSEPQPHEFRSKPVWQRLIVMTGGVIMNVLLGILIFSLIKYYYGEYKVPATEAKYGIEIYEGGESIGSKIGFQTGDSIINYKGESFYYFNDYLASENLIADGAYYTVKREGKEVRLDVPGDIQNYFNDDSVVREIFALDAPPKVQVPDSVQWSLEGPKIASPAYAGGLRDDDLIIKLDSFYVNRFSGVRRFMRGKKFANIDVQVRRGNDTLTFTIKTDSLPKLGVANDREGLFVDDTIKYGFFEAFKPGTKAAFGALKNNVQGFKNLYRENVEVSKSIMGPIQIAKAYLETFRQGGLGAFIQLTGMLSMVLAFINILPIPALDGGHVVFLLIEAVTRKEPSVKVRLIAQQIGMVLVLMLMIFFLFNDVIQII